jgi:hypothetical protein
MAKKPTNGIDNTRIRLLADRLAYVNGGLPALIWRHGMLNADRAYRDAFDEYAKTHAAELLPDLSDKSLQVCKAEPEWVQLGLMEGM